MQQFSTAVNLYSLPFLEECNLKLFLKFLAISRCFPWQMAICYDKRRFAMAESIIMFFFLQLENKVYQFLNVTFL